MRRIAPTALIALFAGLALLLAACGEDPEVGLDEAPQNDAGDAVDDAGDAVDDVAPDEAGDAVDDVTALAADTWAGLQSSPSARTEIGAAAYLDKVWAVGGFDGDGAATDDVAVYDPTFDEWEQGPALPEAVHHTAVVAHGDELWVLGGYTGDGFDAPSDAVWQFDPTTGEWAAGPALPAPRGAGAAASDGDRVVYAGGVGPGGLAGDVWALEGGEWRSLGELEQPREHLAAAADGDGRVWLLGGRTGGLDSNLAAVDLVEGDTVEEIAELPTARGGLAGFFHPDVGACAVGGEAPGSTFAEVECVDADGEGRTLPSLAEPRHGLGAAVIGDVAYTVMGGSEPGLAVSDAVGALLLDE